VFITGGNGSGKTTFMYLFCGLYQTESGDIILNGKNVDKDSYTRLRAMFSAVFNPPHLFDRLYGLENVDTEELHTLLKEFDLDQKTSYKDDKYTNIDLSTGQRKRLAVASILMEKREVLLFDEIAADQDPHFRKYIYTELLPRLKAKGKTIIVITHDDAYFSHADRIVKLEEGKVVEEK
jgi:putative ATP-binding cassette transporter